jgi:hypothetical protein
MLKKLGQCRPALKATEMRSAPLRIRAAHIGQDFKSLFYWRQLFPPTLFGPFTDLTESHRWGPFRQALATGVFTAALFPFFRPVSIGTKSDTQIWTFVLAVIVVTVIVLGTRDRRSPAPLLVLLSVAAFSVFDLALRGDFAFGVRSVFGYISVPLVGYVAFKTYRHVWSKTVPSAVVIWLIVGLIQAIWDRGFGASLLPRVSTGGVRGIVGLTPEPSALAFSGLLMLVLNEFAFAEKRYSRPIYYSVIFALLLIMLAGGSGLGILLVGLFVTVRAAVALSIQPNRLYAVGDALIVGVVAWGLYVGLERPNPLASDKSIAVSTSTSAPIAVSTSTSAPIAVSTSTSAPIAVSTSTSVPIAVSTSTSAPIASAIPVSVPTNTVPRNLSGSRGRSLLARFLDDPLGTFERDESVGERTAHILLSGISLYESKGLGYGPGTWNDNALSLVAAAPDWVQRMTLRKLDLGGRVMSGWGSAVYELGLVGVVFSVMIFLIFVKSILASKKLGPVTLTSTLLIVSIMLGPVPLALPLFAYIIGIHLRIAYPDAARNPAKPADGL